MKELLNSRLGEAEESLIRKFSQLAVKLGAKHILTLGEPDFDTPNEMKQSLVKALEAGKTSYGMSAGNEDFRQAISAFEKRVNHVQYDPSEIVITAGATESLTVALLTMLNPGDEVINLTPAYPLYKNVVTFAGAKMVNIDISKHHFQLSTDVLEAAITKQTKVIVLTSPNNPTGTMLSDESLDVVYEAVKKHQFFVISDEVYNQIVYDKRRLGFSKYQDIRDYIIVCQSLSKPYAMTGWRLGYLMAPKWFIEEATKAHQYMVLTVNTFVQDGGITALDYDVTEMVTSYRVRRDYVMGRLTAMGLDFPNPDGAFYIFPSIKKFGLGSWAFCEQLVHAEGVALVPGLCFDADDHIRVSYCVDMKTLEAGLDGLERFVATLLGESDEKPL
ncbi:MAG: aminotransferase class I/II-fold pyridoxal phosphate-dependent enzyme [Defluviitaleaceae bacterium]|nr:aminotransferase class I/II-fold pyridoxal phosphate-dependent enzyme [Defluviitaleaceae bacterium]